MVRTFREDVETEALLEGGVRDAVVQVPRRNTTARQHCIAIHGNACHVCKMDFGSRYGEIGEGYIEVHHLFPLAGTDEAQTIDPRNDLRPVCPNCHAMLHRWSPPYSIEHIKSLIQSRISQRSP